MIRSHKPFFTKPPQFRVSGVADQILNTLSLFATRCRHREWGNGMQGFKVSAPFAPKSNKQWQHVRSQDKPSLFNEFFFSCFSLFHILFPQTSFDNPVSSFRKGCWIYLWYCQLILTDNPCSCAIDTVKIETMKTICRRQCVGLKNQSFTEGPFMKLLEYPPALRWWQA